MKKILVDISETEPFECPLRTDLNTCAAIKMSPINHCPKTLDDNGQMLWCSPDDCPLRVGGVSIELKTDQSDECKHKSCSNYQDCHSEHPDMSNGCE